jgi:hypothetical protein
MAPQRNPPDVRRTQSASTVLMLRPAAFGSNPQTAGTNRFQADPRRASAGAAAEATREFDAAVAALEQAGVEIHVFADRPDPACPDAVFPNNWVSLHADGTVVLYPMLAPSRRLERRLELLMELERRGGFRVTRLLDLTHHELRGRFLEGTGSVVFDHRAGVAYACRSPRTDEDVLAELCEELGYRPHPFDASDDAGAPVYHTNVLMSVGTRFALVCADSIAPAQRSAVIDELGASGREVMLIDRRQMGCFAGNLLELRDRAGATVLAMSRRGHESLGGATSERLSRCVDRLVTVDVPTIETLGGGSIRCMIAEVFLPRDDDPEAGSPRDPRR